MRLVSRVLLGSLLLPGALLGAFIVTILDRLTAIAAIGLDASGFPLEFTYFRFILFGLIILLMLRFRPQGLLPERAETTGVQQALQQRGVVQES